MKLSYPGVDLEQEEDAAEFLRVNLVRDEEIDILEMKQTGLVYHVIIVVVLDGGMSKGN